MVYTVEESVFTACDVSHTPIISCSNASLTADGKSPDSAAHYESST